ncbi:MAG: M4 family metallopeptidase [Ignavibacteria bacterium]|nr:M4 family metallopeptidase [Ignavibacteria bacterium]
MKKIISSIIIIIQSIFFSLDIEAQALDYIKMLREGKQFKIQPVEDVALKVREVSKFIRERFAKNNIPLNNKMNDNLINTNQLKINELYRLEEDFDVVFQIGSRTPRFVFPKNGEYLVTSKYHNFALSNTLFLFLKSNPRCFQVLEPEKYFREVEVHKDRENDIIIRYQQTLNDIPIWGKEIIGIFNNRGDLKTIVGNYYPLNDTINIKLKVLVDSLTAIRIVQNHSKEKIFDYFDNSTFEYLNEYLKIDLEPKATKCFYTDDGKFELVWMVEYRPNIYEKYRYFISAKDGSILSFYRTNPSDGPTTGSGIDLFNQTRTLNVFQSKGKFYLLDASKPMYNKNPEKPNGIIATFTNNYQDFNPYSTPSLVASNTNYFNDPVAVSAHYFLSLTYDYYYNTHGRNSVDGNKKNVVCLLHVTKNGMPMQNAFWTGEMIVLGDGGDIFYPFARALDIIAHEFTHGVVQFTVDLEYKFQSGALNEAFADWGGAMVDRDDWYINEDNVYSQFFPMGTRNMADPHNSFSYGSPYWLPAHMNEYQNLPLDKDNGGVHINVGIINKATYLIGSNLGKDKLEKIYYRVLEKRYLTRQANFVDFRIACERATRELFGSNSPELASVQNAFNSVGIGTSGGTSPSKELPPVSGIGYILAIDQQNNYLYRIREKITSSNDLTKISDFPVLTTSGSTYTVSENGDFLLYIDQMSQLRGIDLTTGLDTLLIPFPIFRSIALSGGKNPKLAFTTIEYNPKIYIVDILTDSTKEINLTIPTTSHTPLEVRPLIPINLSWSPSGSILIYDVINLRLTSFGDTTYFADINALDPNTGVIYRLIPTLPEGYHIASPKYSNTSDDLLSFVVYNEILNIGEIYVANLYNGQTSLIYSTSLLLEQPATPCFSPNDNWLVFQSFLPMLNLYQINKQELNSDKFTPKGSPISFVQLFGIPKWIAQGQRNFVDEQITEHNELSIFPNPFIDEIYINTSSLPRKIMNGMKIYNELFQEVKDFSIRQDQEGIFIRLPKMLPQGSYFFELNTEKGKVITKGIKVK